MKTLKHTLNQRHLVFMGLNSAKTFSGGRYHAWMMAEAAAEKGWHVSYITNAYPSFYEDFANDALFPCHDEIEVHISRTMHWDDICKINIHCDVLMVIPHGKGSDSLYESAACFAKRHHANIILMNFESPNWFNQLSPVKRSESMWDGWKATAKNASMILSLSAEGTGYARQFYTNTQPRTLFEHCWPAINTRIADGMPGIPKEKRILLLTRLSYGEHKGASLLPELLCEEMRGYTIVLIVGVGVFDKGYMKTIRTRADTMGIKIDILGRVSEEIKWREFRRSSMVLFPSFFEGFGLPPVEARYAGTPCIAFDLPVLREVNGDAVIYVTPGDTSAMRKASKKVLTEISQLGQVVPPDKSVPCFEDFSVRFDAILKRALYEGAFSLTN